MWDEETYRKELLRELSFSDCLKIMDDFIDFCRQLRVDPMINFTGGDPMLRPDIFNLIDEAKRRNIRIGLLANPHTLDTATCKRLNEHGVSGYQLSLDGLGPSHDSIRGDGSYEKTVKAIPLLKDAGIEVGIMMTLNQDNQQDVLPLMEEVGKLGVYAFTFARVSAVGEGRQYKSKQISPTGYRDLLLQVENKAHSLWESGVRTLYGKKCNLWKLLDYERGELVLPEDKETIFGGCTLGVTGMIILADGSVMACRRFPSFVGNVPKMNLLDIFLSKKMNKYRDYSKMEKCSKCELLQLCRGCPAVAFGQTGQWNSPDPQCWKA